MIFAHSPVGSSRGWLLGRPLLAGALLLAAMVLGGCASTDESVPEWAGEKGENEPTPLVDFVETAKFQVLWHSNVGGSGPNPQHPAATKDAVYGVSGQGVLTRLDRSSGKLLWRIESGIRVSSGGVSSGGGLLLIGGEKGDVLAYGEDARLRWRTKLSSEVLNVSPAIDGVVLARTGDGRIAGLDAASGKRIWLYERSTPALVVRSHAGVAVQNGVAYAGFAGGKLAAINVKNGELLWEAVVSQPSGSTELERISDITSDPVVDDGQVCAIAFQGRVACFDGAQGSPIWNREIAGDKGLAILHKSLYLTETKGSVMALDKTSGSTIWKNDQLLMRRVTAPMALGNFVVVGDYEGYVHALNGEDGRFVGRLQLDGGAIRATPIPLDDGLLVQTEGGELYSLSIRLDANIKKF